MQPYARRNHRELLRGWASKHKTVVLVAVVGLIVIVAIETAAIRFVLGDEPSGWYLLGVTHALAVAAVVGFVLSAFHVSEAEAIKQLRGAWGEDNTRDTLAAAKRRGVIWGSVDSITVATGDIDHLVVTRHGGLLAIDSKWRSAEHLLDAKEMRDSASKARTRARGVVGGLLKAERGQHRSSGQSFTVTPVVVVWGKAQESIPDGAEIEGVRFVRGRELRHFLANLSGDSIDRRAGRALVRDLTAVRDETWRRLRAAELVK